MSGRRNTHTGIPSTTTSLTKSLGIRTFVNKKRRPWKSEEDALLRRSVAIYGDTRGKSGKWDEIASFFNDRKAKDCRKRWINSLDPNLKRGRWTQDEDSALLKAYQEIGPSWYKIAQTIEGRTDDQCAKRYNEVLDPSTCDRLKQWNPEEDLQLIERVKKYGTKWKNISTELPGRTALTCRNRWRKIVADVVRGKRLDLSKEFDINEGNAIIKPVKKNRNNSNLITTLDEVTNNGSEDYNDHSTSSNTKSGSGTKRKSVIDHESDSPPLKIIRRMTTVAQSFSRISPQDIDTIGNNTMPFANTNIPSSTATVSSITSNNLPPILVKSEVISPVTSWNLRYTNDSPDMYRFGESTVDTDISSTAVDMDNDYFHLTAPINHYVKDENKLIKEEILYGNINSHGLPFTRSEEISANISTTRNISPPYHDHSQQLIAIPHHYQPDNSHIIHNDFNTDHLNYTYNEHNTTRFTKPNIPTTGGTMTCFNEANVSSTDILDQLTMLTPHSPVVRGKSRSVGEYSENLSTSQIAIKYHNAPENSTYNCNDIFTSQISMADSDPVSRENTRIPQRTSSQEYEINSLNGSGHSNIHEIESYNPYVLPGSYFSSRLLSN